MPAKNTAVQTVTSIAAGITWVVRVDIITPSLFPPDEPAPIKEWVL